MKRPLYQALASLVMAIENCRKADNMEWLGKHTDRLESLVKNYMPSGSGFDSGVTIDFDASKPNKLVFTTSFHHMDENGYYCGWTDHTVTVKPDLMSGFDLTISGRNRNDIKDYVHEVFQTALSEVVEEYPETVAA